MKIEKIAEKDAERWLLAEMFYGEGADIRRRHLNAEFDSKFQMPGYADAFYKAYDMLDKNKFAQMAIKERKKLDRTAKAGKNLRALKSGNLTALSNGVYFAAAGYVFFYHTETGKDIRKVAEKEAQKRYKQAKTEVKLWRARRQGRNVEKLYP